MVFIHLSDEEKLQVLLLASGLFLVALVVSICLAVTICPLNRWLLERSSKRRLRHAFPSQLLISNVHHANGLIRATQQKGSQSLASYAGPPPAYEAALRATRLQSLTGSLPPINHQPDNGGGGGGGKQMLDWLHPGSNPVDASGAGNYNENEKQLDFGDYFHQPREPAIESCPHAHIHIPIAAMGEPIDRSRQPPIMLRLWVRLMDPGEFVARSRAPRGLGGASGGQTTSSNHRLSLSRQLSIPQFIGSLVNMATGKPQALTTTSQEASGEEATEQRGAGDNSLNTALQLTAATGDFSSIMSNETTTTTTSSSTTTGASGSLSPTVAIDIAASCKASDRSDLRAAADRQTISTNVAIPTKQNTPTGTSATNKQPESPASKPQKTSSPSATFSGSQGNSLANNPITSRVLHMNVASFSYVKDESLISTKQHHQQNQVHFYEPLNSHNSAGSNTEGANIAHNCNEKNTNSKKNKTKESKLCQLVISVCDIENLLNSSWLNERSCALLTNNSAIYIQCEILAPKSKSARLLRLPLKASSGLISSAPGSSATTSSSSSVVGTTVSSEKAHTVNFSTAISAAAVERPTTVIPFGMPAGWHEHSVGSNYNTNMGLSMCPPAYSCSTPSQDASLSKSDVSSSSDQQPQSLITTRQDNSTGIVRNNSESKGCVKNAMPDRTATTNWRHEPSADGKSIVMFSSVPKQVAHQQELAASAGGIQQSRFDCCCSACQALVAGAPELIQFDSVFVSPILSKSIIEDGYVRFRVYSQCKYVNETCLAELKLPLRQLLHSESRDNLGDTGFLPSAAAVTTSASDCLAQQQRPHGHQADFILDNLLANLVTASTGSPLSSLIEQVAAEQRTTAANNIGAFAANGQPEQLESAFRLPWPLNSANNNSNNSSSSSNNNNVAANSASAAAGAGDQQLLDPSDYKPLKSSYSLNDSLYRLGSLREEQQELEEQQEAELERRIEQNYCRSLMVSHWLNYLVAPAYECQLVEEPRGKVILALSYLPTSNRVIFNAHKAVIDNDSYAGGKQIMKNLRFQASTCYLLRFFMVLDGRVVKRKQTPVCKKPEWDSQEPITFDLVNLSKEQPSFVVALVMRNSASGTGSLQNLRPQCNCNNLSIHSANLSSILGIGRTAAAPSRAQKQHGGVQSEPESLHPHQARNVQGAGVGGATAASGFMHDNSCALYRADQASVAQQRANNATTGNERDLVIGHLVLSDNIWREMRAQPRKQIVKQFKIY